MAEPLPSMSRAQNRPPGALAIAAQGLSHLFIYYVLAYFCLFLETGSQYVSEAGLELTI